MGDRGDEALTDSREGEEEKNDTGEEDCSEGGLPGNAHAFDDGVGEVGVETHAGREGQRVVGDGAHEDRTEGRAEAGGGCDGGDGHAGLREDGWVHEDDVRHRDEGGDAGEDLGAPISVESRKTEVAFETCAHVLRVTLVVGRWFD
jgi:hypothetical protein